MSAVAVAPVLSVRPVGRPPVALPSANTIRNAVGRGKFTVPAFAEALEISVPSARLRLERLVEEGVVAQVDQVMTGRRGRPQHLFRLVRGNR
jgi:predicted ArsR family transcriptional regulator